VENNKSICDMSEELEKIESSDGTDDEKVAKLRKISERFVDECDSAKILMLMEHLVRRSKAQIANRAFRDLISIVMQQLDDDGAIALSEKACEFLLRKRMSFLHTIYAVRLMMRDVYHELETFDKAAKVMDQVKEEDMHATFKMEYPKHADDRLAFGKWYVNHYLIISKYWISWDKLDTGKFYIQKRAMPMLRTLSVDDSDVDKDGIFKSVAMLRQMTLFQLAMIYDRNREFCAAAEKYYDVFRQSARMHGINSKKRNTFLQSAVRCAILSDPKKPSKRNILGTLWNDHQTRILPQFRLLENMYLGRIVSSSEIATFEDSLENHQKVAGMDGLTSAKRFICMHNIIAASRVYRNIRISDLAMMMSIDADQAETMAAKLIADRVLKASIDQISGFVEFESAESDASAGPDISLRNLLTAMNDLVFGGIARSKESASAVGAS